MDRHTLTDLATGARLLARLPGYLRRPLSVAQAREIVARRRATRPADLLHLLRTEVYAHAASPYRRLLRDAGWELGDVERAVARDGVEGALRALFDAGVYLTVEEMKGRRPVVRGSLRFDLDPALLRNRRAVPSIGASTSGSRSVEARVPISLASIRDRAVNALLALDSRGGAEWPTAVWGTPGLGPLLWYSACGGPASRWFSAVDPWERGVHARYRQSTRLVRMAGALAGVALPRLEPVSLADPLPIARWLAGELARGRTPHLWCYVSAALRLCRRAQEAGLELAGAELTVTGEPVTEVRLAALRRAGVRALPDYGAADTGGPLSAACVAPEGADDVHFFDDLHALVVARGDETPELPEGALLVSSLRPTAPLVLLNVSLGDRAVAAQRACGCPLAALGWRTHLREIRSFEKLTAGGTNFLDVDVARVLDEVLPRRFGGGPSDYQLVEAERADGRPAIRLRVAPAVGPLDDDAVRGAFLEAIGAGSPTLGAMAREWRDAALIEIERADPAGAGRAKILHLHAAARRAAG